MKNNEIMISPKNLEIWGVPSQAIPGSSSLQRRLRPVQVNPASPFFLVAAVLARVYSCGDSSVLPMPLLEKYKFGVLVLVLNA